MLDSKVDDQTIKRRLASEQECKLDLQLELPKMFDAYHEAVSLYTIEIMQTPVLSRVISLEASLLNSKMIQCIQSHFPQNWKFGKYKRFMLRANGYTILFKKLDNKNKPMNIKTIHSTAISNQMQVTLFDNGHKSIDPILIFGYKKNRIGGIYDPKLVYIDENEVRWMITESAVENSLGLNITRKPTIEKVLPVIKVIPIKKASNDDTP